MNIDNFYIYFNPEEKHFLTKKCSSNDEYFAHMKLLINNEETKDSELCKNLHYLLNFSTIGKLK